MESGMVTRRFRGFLTKRMLWLLAAIAAPLEASFDGLSACVDYHCDRREIVELTAAQWDRVRAEFVAVDDPAAERRAIRRAIARLETYVGAITGTAQDLAQNRSGAGSAGQLDCIAESLNTTTYLQRLAALGLLRWHVVEPRVRRNLWIVLTHWTAVISERHTGRQFAVDSWFLDNGQLPYVQPLEHWRRGAAFAEAP
jgi:hypothetical protein